MTSARPSRCTLCTSPARYKCPRCGTPTCSLPCSRKHKQDTKCTGERDKAQYVPMNAYGWGTMMRDYCYLEDINRRVSEWGNEIVRGGYTNNVGASKAARKNASGRKPTGGKSKRDTLRERLESLGIDVELLPAGMERRNGNQSTFDQKSQCCLLTIEFIFYPPTTLASISSSSPPPHKILSHRNSLSATLLALLQRQVSLTQRQKQNTPDWLPSIVNPHPEAPECFVLPHCYLRANTEFPQTRDVAYYHELQPNLSLSELLQRTSFIEFPTIHVFDPDASSFCGAVIDKSGSIVRVLEDERVNVARAAKRTKVNNPAGLKAVFNQIGGYGSEDNSPSEETPNKHQAGLATLVAYSWSDDDVVPKDTKVEEDESLNSDDDATDEGNHIDPHTLLELVKQAQSADDEDVLDWEDDWDIDTEEQIMNAALNSVGS